jgi:hypothetical protein
VSDPIARTVKDFCRAYGIGKTKTFELIKNGTLQTVKIGRRTLIVEESARSLLGNLPTRFPTNMTRAGTNQSELNKVTG